MRKKLLKAIGSAAIAMVMFFSSIIPSYAAASNYPLVDGYANITTLKGRQNWQEMLSNEQHAFQNFDITQCYLPDDYVDVGIPYYEFEGKQYRFYDYKSLIGWIKGRNNDGKTTNVQFMISWEARDTDGYGTLSQRRLLIDDAARTPGYNYYAPATSGEGKQILRAFWSWLMDSLAAQGAHIDNIILGNEVNAPNSWHYSGNIGTQATVEKYASAFYDIRQVVRNYSDKTRISVCFDHTWNYYDGVIGAKEYLRIFNDTLTNLNGGTVVDDWCVAMHLYPCVLYQPAIWEDTPGYPTNMNELSENTRWFDGRNLSYVTTYIKNTYGENHRIMLTEQGFTAYRGDAIQAASLAYSYYAAKYDPMVDCFILYTSNESAVDSRLDFSINGRTAQYVYENIDDPAHQTNIANTVLPTIGVSSWNQIIPNYGQTIQRKQYQGSGFTGKIEPAGITLNSTSLELLLGKSQTLTATVTPSDAYDKTVTWTSSNPNAVSVNNGVVTATGAGTATITAQTVNGLQAQCTVRVIIKPTGITLNTSEEIMIVGDTLTLTSTITPSNATETSITWSSSDTSVATVNNGVVTAKGAGEAVITVQTVNGFKAKCTIYSLIDDNPDNPFGDVNSYKGWEYPYVKYVYDNQYMTGKGEIIPGKIKFAPSAPIKRSEFVQILYNLEGKPEVTYTDKFTDVPDGKWYTDAVIWAAEEGIVAGQGDIFNVDGKATRQQLALMFQQYAKYKNYDLEIIPDESKDLANFEDVDDISSWAQESMQWAISYEIMSGKGTTLKPKAEAKRSECATMLKAFIETFMTESEESQEPVEPQEPEETIEQ